MHDPKFALKDYFAVNWGCFLTAGLFMIMSFLRNLVPDNSSLRLAYHKLVAVVAATFYGFPSSRMTVIAVTGTHGKTTVVNMLAAILQEAGKKVGVSSTVYFQVGERRWRNDMKQTTPGRFFMQKLLKQMADIGCDVAVIETTSHAMVQSRLWGINVDTAILTNVQKDHLEYHGGFENYRAAKARLFRELNLAARKPKIQKISILNADDPSYEYFERLVADRMFSFSVKGKGSIKAENIEAEPNGTKFTLHIPNHDIDVHLKVPGIVNVYNALAAASAAVAHDIGLPVIKHALEKFVGIPGRLEPVAVGQSFAIIVDYAHTTEALEQLCRLFRPLTTGKLILVFGATGGGRDKLKRPKMGEIADKYVDKIILTNDDPYLENQVEIINQITKGIKREEGKGFWKIVNRKEAIRLALTLARKGDTVLIAGKGGERVMVIGDKKIPWNDTLVVKELLAREVKIVIDEEEKEMVNKCFEG